MEIRLLGSVEIRGDAGVARLRRSGERCVLAVLALHVTQPVTVATLVDHLWLATEQSNKSIDTAGTYLRTVRAAIAGAGGEAGWLRYDRAARACVLDIDPAWVDYHRFTAMAATARRERDPVALQGALRLWRGPALADVGGHWADNRRHTMESERLACHEDLLDHQLVEQRYAEVFRTVTDLVEDSTPTDRLLLLGARGLAGSGRHTGIRAWVARVTERMRETVDAAPSAEVLHEVERLIAHPVDTPIFGRRADIPHVSGPEDELGSLLAAVRARVEPLDLLWGRNATLPGLLTRVNTSCDEMLARISQHDRCWVDARRQLHAVRVSQVLRAEQEGADRWILVYDWEASTPDAPRIVGLRNCRLGRVAADHEAHILVAEMLFGRPLVTGETLIMDYQVINPVSSHGDTADAYFRRLRLPVRDYVLEIQFDTEALPLRCQQFSSPAGDIRTVRRRNLTVSPTGDVHAVALGVGPGLFGIEWDWPPVVPAAELHCRRDISALTPSTQDKPPGRS